jgi:hypothetical protein
MSISSLYLPTTVVHSYRLITPANKKGGVSVMAVKWFRIWNDEKYKYILINGTHILKAPRSWYTNL